MSVDTVRRYGHKALSLSRSQHSEQSERTGVPSGSLDDWRQGVLLQHEPAPVLEIVITPPARPLQHQPHHGALQPPPLTINNHQPATPPPPQPQPQPQPESENVLETLAEFLHITKKWHEVLYFTARNPKEVGDQSKIIWIALLSSELHLDTEKLEGPKMRYLKKCFLDLVVQEQRIYFDNKYRYMYKNVSAPSIINKEK